LFYSNIILTDLGINTCNDIKF